MDSATIPVQAADASRIENTSSGTASAAVVTPEARDFVAEVDATLIPSGDVIGYDEGSKITDWQWDAAKKAHFSPSTCMELSDPKSEWAWRADSQTFSNAESDVVEVYGSNECKSGESTLVGQSGAPADETAPAV